jgi:hypothetical protein
MDGQQDDLGSAYLRTHPRGAEWAQLDVTVASLTFDQMTRLADAWLTGPPRDAAPDRALSALTEVRGRMASRWVRWASTFGLPTPAIDSGEQAVLESAYLLSDDPRLGDYVRGLLPLYDAALAIMAGDALAAADYELLSAPWRSVCLPSRFTPGNLFGDRTQPALASLAAATRFPRSTIGKIVKARRDIDGHSWQRAVDATDGAVMRQGYPYRARCLYWEAIPAAENAAGESPTDRELAEALFGFAAAEAFAEILPPTIRTLLRGPYRAGGRVLPPV